MYVYTYSQEGGEGETLVLMLCDPGDRGMSWEVPVLRVFWEYLAYQEHKGVVVRNLFLFI